MAGRNVLLLFRQGGTAEPFATPGGVIPPHGGSGQLHLAFSIAADDLGPWRGRLESEGVAGRERGVLARRGHEPLFS